ncbi:hypothetical protein D3C81_2219260 [compost metagenome]
MGGQQMTHPRRGFLLRTRAAATHDGLQRRQQFGLHKQLAEGRVQCVADGRRQHHLGVAGQLQGTASVTMIGQMQAA